LATLNVRGVGQDGQSRFRASLHVAVNLATFQAKHFRNMFESHAISVAVDEKHRRLGGLELIGTEVVRFRFRREEVLDEIRKFVGRRTQLFVFDFNGRAFEVLRREFR
jgi:hypothetical protein